MALVTISELDPTIERIVIVDPTNVVEQNINNNTAETLELTFVTTETNANGVSKIVADPTVPIPACKPGEQVLVTDQMINDALAAGGHSDIYAVSKRDNFVSTIAPKHVVVAGISQPRKSKKTKDK